MVALHHAYSGPKSFIDSEWVTESDVGKRLKGRRGKTKKRNEMKTKGRAKKEKKSGKGFNEGAKGGKKKAPA